MVAAKALSCHLLTFGSDIMHRFLMPMAYRTSQSGGVSFCLLDVSGHECPGGGSKTQAISELVSHGPCPIQCFFMGWARLWFQSLLWMDIFFPFLKVSPLGCMAAL